jgi:signal transduction histidine kinase
VGRVTLGIAHELKNPLKVIINSAEIISGSINEELDTSLIGKTAEIIYNHGIRANNIINDILKQAHQDSSNTAESVDLSNLSNQALNTCIRSIKNENFKQALSLANHNHSNGGFTPQLSVHLKREDDFMVIEISGNGSRIPAHQQVPFFGSQWLHHKASKL